jgi:hypothetical protein
MLGFPLGELVKVPLHLDPYAQVFLSMCNWVVNIVHHEINFQGFMALGFDAKDFLARDVTSMGYRNSFGSSSQDGAAGEVDFSWWCMEYVRHLVSARHGGGQDHLRHAQAALHQGSRFHAELKQTAAEMERWLETGAFRDPDQYPRQVNLLLDFMRIPPFTGWVTLKASEQHRPVAARLDPGGICRGIYSQTWVNTFA